MIYKIIDAKNKTVKVISANCSKEELLRNYPINYNIKVVK